MKKLNNKGFTLIEILASIVILGVIMVAAIPAVVTIINNSRKDAYIDIVKIHEGNIQRLIAQEDYYVYDENTVYYFDYRIVQDEKSDKSPFGEWEKAYVVVTYDGKSHHYYWTGKDSAGWTIDLKKQVQDLTRKDVYKNENKIITAGMEVENKDTIIVYNYSEDGKVEEQEQDSSLNVTKEEALKCFKLQELNDGSYSIIDYDIKCGTDVVVPSSIDGQTVSIIGENAFRNKGLTSVKLYYGIKELQNGAFQNNKISSLKLSGSITKIGPHAFYQNKLTEISLPEGLKEISEWGFAYNQISEVKFPKSLTTIGSYAFYGNKLKEIELQSNPSILGAAFSNNQMPPTKGIIYRYDSTTGRTDYTTIVGYGGESKDVVIPEMVNGVAPLKIAGSAFASNGLNSVVIPDSVTRIEGAAFYSNNLTSVTLPKNLQYIGGSAFRENKLTSIDIPKSVTKIESAAFVRNCFPAGEDIIYARTSTGDIDYSTIVSGAGGKSPGNLNLVIPAQKNGVKLKEIAASAFSCCYYNSYQLPNLADTNHLTIGNNAFYQNNFADSQAWIYNISNGVVDYSTITSYGGKRSGQLVIPGEKNGTKLKRIYASLNWTSFTSIEVPESVETINNGVFGKSNLNNVNLTKIVNKTGRKFNWYKLTSSTHTPQEEFVTGTVSHQSGDITITDK